MEEQRRQEAEDATGTSTASSNSSTMSNQSGSEPSPTASCSTGGATCQDGGAPVSPQQAVEEWSLQQNKDRNRESLKRKLMLRRSVNELVNQGIYPPLKTPPAFAEKTKQLERAKTGDLLKHKIESRPDRRILVQQHILEDTNVDPSLHERQQQLKKAKLRDSLTERLVHRPGPLELVEGNILQTDPSIKSAIVEGKISYNRTSQGEDPLHPDPTAFDDEDSGTSDNASSPSDFVNVPFIPQDSSSGEPDNIPAPPDIKPLLQKLPGQKFVLAPFASSSLQKSNSNSSLSSLSGSSSSSKVSKSKKPKQSKSSQSKNKIIKFHEYKGPPSSSSKTSSTPVPSPAPSTAPVVSGSDTPYHIMLQQQQLFLQWQLEAQNLPTSSLPYILQKPTVANVTIESQKSPSYTFTTVTAPDASKPMQTEFANMSSPTSCSATTTVTSAVTQPAVMTTTLQAPVAGAQQKPKPPPPPPNKTPKLEDLKVAELKAEAKKRSLPMSGPKPNLINRLQQYADVILAERQAAMDIQNAPSPASAAKISQMTSFINIQPITPQSVIQSEDTSMSSPPLSPSETASDLNVSHHGSVTSGPMSPDMDVHSPPIITVMPKHIAMKSQLVCNNNQQGNLPMQVEMNQSRPSSVAPMDVDFANQSNLVAAIEPRQHNLSNGASKILNSGHVIQQVTSPPHLSQVTSPPQLTQVMSPPQLLQQVFSPPKIPDASTNMTAVNQPETSPSRPLIQVPSPLQTVITSPTRPMQTPSPQVQIFKHPSPVQVVPQSSSSSLLASPAPSPLHVVSHSPSTSQYLSQQDNQTGLVNQGLSPLQLVGGQNASPHQNVSQIQVSPQMSSTSPAGQVMSPLDSSSLIQQDQDDLVLIQRQQIEELQRQLKESQMKLQLAQLQTEPANNTTLDSKQFVAQQIQQLNQQQQQLQRIQQQQQQQEQQQQQQQQVLSNLQQLLQNATPDQIQTLVQALQTARPQPGQAAGSSSTNLSYVSMTDETKQALANALQQQQQQLQPGVRPQQMTNLRLQQATVGGKPKLVYVQMPANSSNSGQIVRQPLISGAKQSSVLAQISSLTNKSASVPTSPIEPRLIMRSSTNPVIMSKLREPPKYDDAVKCNPNADIKNVKLSQESTLNEPKDPLLSAAPATKAAQAMDELLEFLVQTGEMSPSAAIPPKTPNLKQGSSVILPSMQKSAGGSNQAPMSSTLPPSPALSYTSAVSPASSHGSIRKDLPTSLTLANNQATMDQTSGISDLPSSLSDLPFISMDWTDSDSNMNTLDLEDMLATPNTNKMDTNLANVTQASSSPSGSSVSSVQTTYSNTLNPQSQLPASNATLNGGTMFSDPDFYDQFNMDVSDWLDTMIPSTGNTPLTSNAPTMTFSSDPILTPKTQEVLDLFNMEESEIFTPPDMAANNMFDKALTSVASGSKQ